jgi:hypothetical protein
MTKVRPSGRVCGCLTRIPENGLLVRIIIVSLDYFRLHPAISSHYFIPLFHPNISSHYFIPLFQALAHYLMLHISAQYFRLHVSSHCFRLQIWSHYFRLHISSHYFSAHPGNIQCTFREHSVHSQGTFSAPSVLIHCTFSPHWECTFQEDEQLFCVGPSFERNIQGIFSEHSENIQGTLSVL